MALVHSNQSLGSEKIQKEEDQKMVELAKEFGLHEPRL